MRTAGCAHLAACGYVVQGCRPLLQCCDAGSVARPAASSHSRHPVGALGSLRWHIAHQDLQVAKVVHYLRTPPNASFS